MISLTEQERKAIQFEIQQSSKLFDYIERMYTKELHALPAKQQDMFQVAQGRVQVLQELVRLKQGGYS